MRPTTDTATAPQHVVWELAQAVVASRALHLFAELDVADRVDDGAGDQ